MSKLVQIRDLPESAHRVLKSRAALEGKTLSAYLRDQLTEMAGRRTPDEVWASIRSRKPFEGTSDSTQMIRELRDGREEYVYQRSLKATEDFERRRKKKE